MTVHIPMSIRPTPDWHIRDIEKLMGTNAHNKLFYFDKLNKHISKDFPEIRRDALATLSLLKEKGCICETGNRCAIVGDPGYPWILAAVACIMSGVEIVAVPESLNDEDISASLKGIPLNFVINESKFSNYGAFGDLPRLDLDTLLDSTTQVGTIPDAPDGAMFSLIGFTSGSTSSSKLKSFRITSESTELFISTFIDVFELNHDENWIVCHPFSHIVHFEYVLGGLCWGYNVTLADPLRVILKSGELNGTILVSVPSVYEQLVSLIKKKLPGNGIRASLIESFFSQEIDQETHNLARKLQPVLMPEAKGQLGNDYKVMIIGAAPSTEELKKTLIQLGLPIYEGYGMSETNMLACNTPKAFKFGTVGPIWPGVELHIGDEGEIRVRLQSDRTRNYLNLTPDENGQTFINEGWVKTGDIGEIENGFLRIIGRVKELIVTNRGKKVNPEPIQSKLRGIEGVEHALVFGNNKPFLVTVLSPFQSNDKMDRTVISMEIDKLNQTLPSHERILDFILLEKPLSEADGTLTRSGKPRRSIIEQRYSSDLECLYDRFI